MKNKNRFPPPKPDPYAHELALAAQHGQAGRLEEANHICQKILNKAPKHAGALHLSGIAAMQLGQFSTAIDFLERALKINPKFAEAQQHLGLVYCQQGEVEKGVQKIAKALALRPQFAEAHYNIAMMYTKLKQFDLAEKHYNKALKLTPNNPAIIKQLGNLYQEQKKFNEAIAYYDEAMKLSPNSPELYYNRGIALQFAGKTELAIQNYEKALQLNPHYDEAKNNLGTLYTEQDRYSIAIPLFQAVLQRNPQFVPSIKNLADAYCKLDKYSDAIVLYKQGLAIEPDNIELLNGLVITLKNDCVWDDLEMYRERLLKKAGENITEGKPPMITPFASLSMWLDFKGQYDIAVNHAAHTFKQYKPDPKYIFNKNKKDKLRIGYVSADFRDHPVTHLVSGVLEKHHRDRFEIFAYSIGPNDNSIYRERVKKGVDYFVDLHKVPTEHCADKIYQDNIDILIDLMGYTQYARPEIFALQPAPIQIGYVGYPGTSGTPFMDYYIADKIIVPPEEAPYFSEKLIYLPDTYYSTDDKMQIAEQGLTRAECGLPENAFVYCCFCTHYKLEPKAFSAWMKILNAVDKSVLWLFSRTTSFEANLRNFAAKHGVDPTRLIFAGRQSKEKHLARHEHADLFLDTLIYNAHTTAVDSLWTGLPLLTLLGNSMATRVSASLLTAVELPELIAPSLEQYIERATYYGKNPTALQNLKLKLKEKIKSAALYNTERYVTNLESALWTVWNERI